MEKFKSIEEVLQYVNYLIKIDNNDISIENIEQFNKFLKFSPEKMARRFELDELDVVKEFNQYKKEINKKLIIYKKVKELKNKKIIPFGFNYSKQIYDTKVSFCEKFFEIKYEHKTTRFYPTIKYLYVKLDDNVVLFPNNNYQSTKLYMTYKEFDEHFIDMREYKINQILDIK